MRGIEGTRPIERAGRRGRGGGSPCAARLRLLSFPTNTRQGINIVINVCENI